MAIYSLTDKELVPVSATSFTAENIHERTHIQQLLKANITVLDAGLMVIAEEFGEWIDSSRRIDLLCLDSGANLVVVELKRTEDGGHMELQALRYAAMISAMTFEQLVETHARFLNPGQPDHEEAGAAILKFLGWDGPDEDQFGQDTRIILASANFSKELTTAVLWLRDRDIDIRCMRLQPYRMDSGVVLLDVQPIIPLPETASFQTQIGVKRQAERKHRTERHDLRYKFWEGLLEFARARTDLHINRKPTKDNWIAGGIGRKGFQLSYVIRQQDSQVELWISHGKKQADKNRAAFEQLQQYKQEIEASFGAPLDWMPLENNDGCRIRYVIDGGWKTSPERWPETYEQLVDAMIRLNIALRDHVAELKL
ncbi:DUF4268 domain-containing protein [Qipengyuania sp. 902]|uniref:DUF4268 domain-containing protein n=1 Tax=Qipengyuania sp. 902 TaxID=3417565 RepID=UPI003EBB338E